jgi:hypothetical protein
MPPKARESRQSLISYTSERISRRRKKRGAVKVRIVASRTFAHTDNWAKRHESIPYERDEIIELRPGDSIVFFLETGEAHRNLEGREHDTIETTRYEAIIMPPDD